ncbi:MAG: sialic acid TRAP transporter substrate-binding protein SiaP [Alphaproteobacteria bacterium]
MTHMKQLRGALAAALVGASAAGAFTLGAGTAALAQDPVTIRISTPAVPGDWHAEMLSIFKEWLERSASGQFDVQVHLNATLFAQGTEPAAMQRGNLEVALISAQDIAKELPEYSIFTAGYLIRDPDHQQAVFQSDVGQEYFAAVRDVMGIQILDVAYLGTRQLNLRDVRDVQTPADLAGLNLRMPGSDTWLFLGSALGANPTPLAFGEIYTGLQTGAIDGQDNPLPTNLAAGFYEVTNQIVLTGHLVDGVFFAFGGDFWDGLEPEQQELVREAAAAAIQFNNQNRIRQEAQLLAFFEEHGLTITTPDVDAFRSHVQQMYLESEYSSDWPEGLLDRINAVE